MLDKFDLFQLESYRGDLAEFVKQNEEELREVQSARRQQVQALWNVKTSFSDVNLMLISSHL